jgi:hypothetical protein
MLVLLMFELPVNPVIFSSDLEVLQNTQINIVHQTNYKNIIVEKIISLIFAIICICERIYLCHKIFQYLRFRHKYVFVY